MAEPSDRGYGRAVGMSIGAGLLSVQKVFYIYALYAPGHKYDCLNASTGE